MTKAMPPEALCGTITCEIKVYGPTDYHGDGGELLSAARFASSLVAFHEAVESILRRHCDAWCDFADDQYLSIKAVRYWHVGQYQHRKELEAAMTKKGILA